MLGSTADLMFKFQTPIWDKRAGRWKVLHLSQAMQMYVADLSVPITATPPQTFQTYRQLLQANLPYLSELYSSTFTFRLLHPQSAVGGRQALSS